MIITLTVNGTEHTLNVHAGELLRTALRRLRYYSVKHGDETGESGADAVLLTFTPDQPTSYRLLNAGTMLAAQADGASIVTAEGLVIGDWGSGRDLPSPQSPIPSPRSPIPGPPPRAIRPMRRHPVWILHAGAVVGRAEAVEREP